MPNTLAHAAAQGWTGSVAGLPARWALLGCLIPDLPWILQRGALLLQLPVDPLALRTYAVAQASLLGCCVLAVAIGLLARRTFAVSLVLVVNSALHLLLDALEIKLGNGVHLFAPLSWEPWSAGFYWPESLPVSLLTVAGAFAIVWLLRRQEPSAPASPDFLWRPVRACAASLLLAVYALGPLAFEEAVIGANAHQLATLSRGSRSGAAIAFDRAPFRNDGHGSWIRLVTGEELRCRGHCPEGSGWISGEGRFLSHAEIELVRVHVHWPYARDLAALLGLTGIGVVWLRALGPASRGRSQGGGIPAEPL